MYRQIVAGTDLSKTARIATDRAADRAARAGAPAETRALQGPAAEALLDVAEGEDFDLIVVGNVGMTGAKRVMLGSVPHRISHHSPTDVLIVGTG